MTRLHVLDAAVHAVVNTLDVHLEDTVELFFGCSCESADVSNAGVVHQNVDWLVLHDLVEDLLHVGANTYIASMRLRFAACAANFSGDSFCVAGIHIDDVHAGPVSGEEFRDGAANTAPAAGYD